MKVTDKHDLCAKFIPEAQQRNHSPLGLKGAEGEADFCLFLNTVSWAFFMCTILGLLFLAKAGLWSLAISMAPIHPLP